MGSLSNPDEGSKRIVAEFVEELERIQTQLEDERERLEPRVFAERSGQVERLWGMVPELLDSDTSAKLRRFKRRCVVQLFLEKGPFWEAVCDVRARLHIGAKTGLPQSEGLPSDARVLVNALVPANRSLEERSTARPTVAHELVTLADRVVAQKYRSRILDVPWIAFLFACVHLDPPEEGLLDFAAYADPEPIAFANKEEKEPKRRRLMAAPPIRRLRDPGLVRVHVHAYWAGLISRLQEEHLEPLGLDVWEMLEDVHEKHPEARARTRENAAAIPSHYYIKVDEGTSEADARRAFGLIKDALGRSSEGGAPPRDPLVALQCAILYDRHNGRDPEDGRRKKWTYKKLEKKFGLRSPSAAEDHVRYGREILKAKPKE